MYAFFVPIRKIRRSRLIINRPKLYLMSDLILISGWAGWKQWRNLWRWWYPASSRLRGWKFCQSLECMHHFNALLTYIQCGMIACNYPFSFKQFTVIWQLVTPPMTWTKQSAWLAQSAVYLSKLIFSSWVRMETGVICVSGTQACHEQNYSKLCRGPTVSCVCWQKKSMLRF